MEKQPDVSIITINYQGLKDTCELIESIKNHIYLNYELIVIDNASDSNESEYLKAHYPDIICIRSDKNLGFSGGNNLGIRVSRGKYIFLINNDAFFKDNSIQYLIEKLSSSPQIGAVSPKIKFAYPPYKIQYAGYTPLSKITLRNRPIGFGEKDFGQYDVSSCTSYLHGAAIMIKKEVIQKAGLMPEIYFLYYEELDWSTQIIKNGFQLYYEPKCTIFHKESQSTGQDSSLRVFYMTRNRLLYAFRNLNGIFKYLSIAYQLLFIVLLKNSFFFLIRGRIDLYRAAFSGAYGFFIIKNKKAAYVSV